MRNVFFFLSMLYLGFPAMNVITATLEAASIEAYTLSVEEIDVIATDALETCHVPGVAIGIVCDDHVVLSKGFGFRDVSQKLPVTECTLFPIASCTKAFTALALGLLVEEDMFGRHPFQRLRNWKKIT